MPKTTLAEAEYLRELAEAAVKRVPRQRFAGIAQARLEHELEVHATELEMQNEALREAHAELELSRAEYRYLFDHAPVALVTVERTGFMRSANLAAAELLGVPQDKLVGTRFSRFISQDQVTAFEHYRREVIGSTHRIRAHIVLTVGNGESRSVMLEAQCASPMMAEWRMAIVDLTHTTELERQVERSERLALLGTHASGIVHDFKNILSSMVTAGELASRQLEPDHPARRSLDRLKQTALRGGTVVTQLLAFSRDPGTESGFVDLNTFVLSLESVLRAQLGSTVELTFDLAAADAAVRADGGQIEQVLLNLTTNARHAMPNGGTVSITTSNEDVGPTDPSKPSEAPDGRYVVMRVVDSGSGMDERTVARAFEPFFTTKPAGRGSGLGLPLVQAVAHRAGGFATVDSKPGHGTTVAVYLPRASEFLRTQTERPPAHESLPADLLVVLVADDTTGRRAARDYFRSFGCRALDAANEFEALGILTENRDGEIVLLVDTEQSNLARIEFSRLARAAAPSLRIAVASLRGIRKSDTTEESQDPEARSRLMGLYDLVVRTLTSLSSRPPA